MTIINQRMTAIIDKPFVVFLIGLRINRPWKFHQWYPLISTMPRMLKELEAGRAPGFLGASMWDGRTTIMVQYWESFDALERYAKERDSAHLPAWREFNRRIASGGDVGIWHETYLVNPGQYECVYHNMPPFGLGRVGTLVEARGALSTARGRLQRDLTPVTSGV